MDRMDRVNLRLSQGHLNTLSTCGRKFQYIFLEKIPYVVPPEQQERSEWGSQFHLLMQQRELGLPIEGVLQSDPQFKQGLERLMIAHPGLFADGGDFRESEHQRTLVFEGYWLTVIYDLFIARSHQAEIIDWKTYLQPPKSDRLKQNWQTRLYPFVLAETSDYLPEQIALTYWFVKGKPSLHNRATSLEFRYDNEQHERTKTELSQLLHQLSQGLQHYAQGGNFPQVPVTSSECRRCPFARRCDRLSTDEVADITPDSALWSLPPLDSIPELPI
ncbi:PD-(D/E)XK nuclease family protein [Roseofilum capinflatum]|uniref:PD-(D/E)XK nuclease family protein n=1 Tax=Roseofilum capinflatum BLCC-M114 TaxID=3022440 RepID=A0ABT7BCI8_9CYAN|nr:PD-(D/E)XK nuclease family protein [Roseofilum capinflatum]MDJ1176904.1 PD-(D/E)XK nuclease family protein [Roseofilum capinflatum BLCC-M114]